MEVISVSYQETIEKLIRETPVLIIVWTCADKYDPWATPPSVIEDVIVPVAQQLTIPRIRKFVQLDLSKNRSLMPERVRQIPTTEIFRNGSRKLGFTGNLSAEKFAEIVEKIIVRWATRRILFVIKYFGKCSIAQLWREEFTPFKVAVDYF